MVHICMLHDSPRSTVTIGSPLGRLISDAFVVHSTQSLIVHY